MLRQGPETLKHLRKISDELCTKYGYSVLSASQKRSEGTSAREYRSAAKGESKKLQLMNVINDCMCRAGSQEQCKTYRKEGSHVCTSHYIREVALKEIVLETIRRNTEFARNHPEQFAEYIQQKQSTEVSKEIRQIERELSAKKKRDTELDTIFKREKKYSKCAPQEVHIRFRDFDLNDTDGSLYDEKAEKADSANALSA